MCVVALMCTVLVWYNSHGSLMRLLYIIIGCHSSSVAIEVIGK